MTVQDDKQVEVDTGSSGSSVSAHGRVGRTYLILDGLQDPALGRDLSRRWVAAGFDNAVDVAGQAGWIARADVTAGPLSEDDVDRAAGIARAYGVEVRDRAGSAFKAENDLAALREQVAREYKSRMAQTLVYGLPALALHYFGGLLAGGGDEPRAMLYPWLMQALLMGWVCFIGGWPIIWQGVLSAVHLRPTGDLLTSAIILATYLTSAAGLAGVIVTDQPWMDGSPGPAFHATFYVILLATLQRWLAHRDGAAMAGRADLMAPGVGKIFGVWLVAGVIAGWLGGLWLGLATWMLMPPLLGLASVSLLTPGRSPVLPVVGFAVVLWLGPSGLGLSVDGVEVEVAAGFQLLMVGAMAVGWRGMRRAA